MTDVYDKKTRSYVMSRIRSKNTKPEITLKKALRKAGVVGYRSHPKMLGNPDIVFRKNRVVIFVDGEFWHGHDFRKVWRRIKDKPYWRKKIVKNMERDKLYNQQLKSQGWIVLRFWEHQINKNILECVIQIKRAIK